MASTFSLQTSSYQGRYLSLYCEQVKNIDGNYSTINWTLSSVGGSSNFYAVGPTTVIINGNTVYYEGRVSNTEKRFPAAKGSVSGSLIVYHDSTGYAKIPVSLSTAIYTHDMRYANGDWLLDSIERPAYITAITNFNDEQNPTITYVNPSGYSATSVQVCMTDANSGAVIASYRDDISKTSGTYPFTFTDSERALIRQYATANNTTELSVNFVMYTDIGGSYFWEQTSAKVSLINSSPVMLPTMIPDEATRALTGVSGKIIKYHSDVEINQHVTLRKGATIAAQNNRNGSQTIAGNSGTFTNVETNLFAFWVRDNRGEQDYQELELPMIDYIPLTCNLDIVNVETQGNITFRLSGNYFNGSFGAQNNELTLAYWYTKDDGTYTEETYITPTFNGNTYSIDITLSDLDYKSLYTIKAWASDKLEQINATDKQVKIEPVFDWGKEDFNFNVPVTINNNPIIYPVEEGTSGNWHYKKWSNGELECWGDIPISFSTAVAWGYGYISSNNNATATVDVSLPSGMFATIEAPVVTVYRAGLLFTAMGNYYDTSKISLYIWAPTGPYNNVQATASIRVKGTWNID